MYAPECMYASKPCTNPRSLKPNGELHRLCTLHRIKANEAQRRWHTRQRKGPTDTAVDAPLAAATRKRRRTSTAKSSDSSSECDVADVPDRRRHRRSQPSENSAMDAITVAQAALSMNHTGFVPMLQQLNFNQSSAMNDDFSDEELAQLGECIFELDECKVAPTTVTTGVQFYNAYDQLPWMPLQEEPAGTIYEYCL